ncbi:MAG: cobalt ECF transporter T component CbiQ [Candidatus Brocadiia bacterium]
MVCETFSQGHSIVHRLDPRARAVVAAAFSVVVALAGRWPVLAAALVLAVGGAAVARLPLLPLARRLAGLNAFLLVLWLVLPFTVEGTAVFHVGPLAWTAAGAARAMAIWLKANAIVLALTVLLGTMEITALGHALHHLRVPRKLAHLLLFTVRYIDLIHHEYRRLRNAMRVRCFRPRANRHTYRAYGNLVGMLLVRSFDRAERVLAAMKCRGFRGQFHLLDHFAFARRDLAFALGSALVLGLLAWGAWL